MSAQNRIASRSQLLELAGKLAQYMPADLPVDMVQEWIEDKRALQQFVAGLRKGAYPVGQIRTYEFDVVIYPKRTVEGFVTTNFRTISANEHFTTRNFGQFLTVKGSAQYGAKVVAFDPGFWVTIGKIDRSVSSDKIIKHIRSRLNLKPIGFEHIAAVCEQYPGAQPGMPCIINLDAVWTNPLDGHDYVTAIIDRKPKAEGARDLGLIRADYKWLDNNWFFGLKE